MQGSEGLQLDNKPASDVTLGMPFPQPLIRRLHLLT